MKTLLVVGIAIALAIAWAVHLVRRPFAFTLDPFSFDRLPAISLSLAVAGAVVMCLWGAQRRGRGPLVLVALGAVAITAVLGASRVEPLTPRAEFATAACWLAAAAAVLGAVVIGSGTFAVVPRDRFLAALAAVVLTGLLAAALGAGRSPVTPLELGPAGRLALGAHAAVLAAVGVWLAVTIGRPAGPRRRGAVLRDPVVAAGLAWVVVAVGERVVHLLPLATYLRLDRGGYRPWSLASALYLPLIATIAVVVALGWSLAVRPRVERLASGVVVVPDRDPIVALRDDLAAWTGDPTLELAYADDAGGWVGRSGDVPAVENAYHRAATVVTHDGLPIGMIDHDLALAQAPDALRTAAEMAGVAFHANQLLALSEARLAETRQLGQRLLVADARTREAVLSELEAGPIGELEACADAVRFGAPVADVVDRIRRATADVRLLSHGLYPPELVEGGLWAALGDRSGVPTRRLPAALEITLFLLAADDPGSRFEDLGPTVRVHRSRPDVERSLADRVEVLGGSVVGCSVSLPVTEP